MNSDKSGAGIQKKFDFSAPRQRPFLAGLPGRIDTYEEGVARLFHWRTGLDYYATIDQIIDFIVDTGRAKIVDLLCDTAAFALRLAGRKAFFGQVHCFDSNVTLLERARQRARLLHLEPTLEFRQFDESEWPLADGFAEIAVSIFDFHRRPAQHFLKEAFRILAREGYLLIGEMLEPGTLQNRLVWNCRKMHLRFVQRNSPEARGIYYNREEMIRMLFETGFRQVVIQGSAARLRRIKAFSASWRLRNDHASSWAR